MQKNCKIKLCFTALMIILFTVFTLHGIRIQNELAEQTSSSFIKWVDFDVCTSALNDAYKYDVETVGRPEHIGWVELLAVLGSKNGGNFGAYTSRSLKNITDSVKNGTPFPEISGGLKYYDYYRKAYGAVLDGMVGWYQKSDGELVYGLKAYFPLAYGYDYGHYDDFGDSRSYGYKREHLGHDLLGSVGTPVIAVESGYVEACGWNQYGGWRIGIRSFDGKRYYYYAHLRKNHPYNDIYEGKIVYAGEVIGYLGMTGYSKVENTNNIDTPHLHIGLQLIFDKSQIDGNGEIWIDLYDLTRFLSSHRAKVCKDEAANEYYSSEMITDWTLPD